MKRTFVALASIAGLAFSGHTLAGTNYPERNVRLVVPYSAGGLADNLARGIAQELGKKWNQAVVVDNRPGANTIVAAREVASAPADGYTILFANTSTLSSNQYLYQNLPYDPEADFDPVINVAETALILVARNDFPADTIPELIEHAKKHPGEVNYGSFGAGSNPHLDTEAFADAAGVKLNHVPYKGVADIVNALMGNHIDIGLVGISATVPLIRDNRIKPIAMFAPSRSPVFPDVPTLAEQGIEGVESRSWFGFVVPHGTPDTIIDKIATDTASVISNPDFEKRYMTDFGLELLNLGPAEYQAHLDRERPMFEQKIRESGVKLD